MRGLPSSKVRRLKVGRMSSPSDVGTCVFPRTRSQPTRHQPLTLHSDNARERPMHRTRLHPDSANPPSPPLTVPTRSFCSSSSVPPRACADLLIQRLSEPPGVRNQHLEIRLHDAERSSGIPTHLSITSTCLPVGYPRRFVRCSPLVSHPLHLRLASPWSLSRNLRRRFSPGPRRSATRLGGADGD